MTDVLVQALAMLGAMALGLGALIAVQAARRQMHPERNQPCCPPLPPGQHFTGCTNWPSIGPSTIVPPHLHVYFGQTPSVRQPCEWCDLPASAKAVRGA